MFYVCSTRLFKGCSRDDSCSMSVLQGYLKGALLKKQLIASFVEQFKLNLENTSTFGRAPYGS